MNVRGEPTGVEYLDHTADVGIRARGGSVEGAFERAAAGLFSLMVRLDAVEATASHAVVCRGETLDDLLVEWLSELLVQKDLSGLVFGRFEVDIGRGPDGHELRGIARGEALDPSRHALGIEVKGISYLGLSVAQAEDGAWIAECVVDV